MLMERKKQKKLRQKGQKVREQYYGCSGDLNVYADAIDRPTSDEACGISSPSSSNSNSQDVPPVLDSVEPQNRESDEDIEAQFDVSIEHKKQVDYPASELQMMGVCNHRHVVTNRLQVPKSQRGTRYGLNAHSNLQTSKPEPSHKLGPSTDRSSQNVHKVWTKKLKSNNDGGNLRPPLQEVTSHQTEQDNGEVIIGSIPVTLKSYIDQQQESFPSEASNVFSTEHAVLKKKNASEKRVASKLWRPVIRDGTKNVPPVGRSNGDHENGAILSEARECTPASERSGHSHSPDSDGCHNGKQFLSNDYGQRGFLAFSSEAAKEFLARSMPTLAFIHCVELNACVAWLMSLINLKSCRMERSYIRRPHKISAFTRA